MERIGRHFVVFACAFVTALAVARPMAAIAAPTFTHPLDITNPYHPFQPGAVKIYTGHKDGKASVLADLFLSTPRTFQLNGTAVQCAALQETEFEGGQLIEISTNFSAQADDGTVYYFGEVVDTYDNGAVVGHEGSWLVGGPTLPSDPAETIGASAPGVFMPASPRQDDTFKPEDLLPFLDETDTVKGVNQSVNTPAGRLTPSIQILETSALPGEIPETMWYAAGVGVVKGRTQNEDFTLVASTLFPQPH